MPLTLASLNIDGNKHFDKFIPFFKKADPDVICLQEVFSQDLLLLRKELGMEVIFAPMTMRPYITDDPTSLAIMGVAICSKLPLDSVEPIYYFGNSEMVPLYRYHDETRQHRPLLFATATKENERFVIATTHFMVTDEAKPTDYQRRDLASVLKITESIPEIIMCGDFNAPRGDEIFDALAKRFTDNIPVEYTTSIDGTIHRKGPLPYMVDGLFTSPQYRARNVKLNSGISDHMGITAVIEKM